MEPQYNVVYGGLRWQKSALYLQGFISIFPLKDVQYNLLPERSINVIIVKSLEKTSTPIKKENNQKQTNKQKKPKNTQKTRKNPKTKTKTKNHEVYGIFKHFIGSNVLSPNAA